MDIPLRKLERLAYQGDLEAGAELVRRRHRSGAAILKHGEIFVGMLPVLNKKYHPVRLSAGWIGSSVGFDPAGWSELVEDYNYCMYFPQSPRCQWVLGKELLENVYGVVGFLAQPEGTVILDGGGVGSQRWWEFENRLMSVLRSIVPEAP